MKKLVQLWQAVTLPLDKWILRRRMRKIMKDNRYDPENPWPLPDNELNMEH